MAGLTHFDEQGQAHMVDVSQKKNTNRIAVSTGWIKMQTKKGDALNIAQLAGIMGAKKTPDLIPLCHPLTISKVSVELTLDHKLPGVRINSTVKSNGQTGVEMEALTAISVAALTVYDMLKAADKTMEIGGIKVLLKDGGKSGRYEAQ